MISGTYRTVEASIDDEQDDGSHASYIETLETGFAFWHQAGFAPPEFGKLTASSQLAGFVVDAVASALRITRPSSTGAFFPESSGPIHRNLNAAFPRRRSAPFPKEPAMLTDSERFAFSVWRIHAFASTGNAYDAVQTDESIAAGDTLLVLDERVVGVAMTWPLPSRHSRASFTRSVRLALAKPLGTLKGRSMFQTGQSLEPAASQGHWALRLMRASSRGCLSRWREMGTTSAASGATEILLFWQ